MFKRLKDYFIPHEGNGYAPDSLEKAAMIGMLSLVIISFTVANILTILWPNSGWMVSTVLPAVVVNLTNEERDSASLGTLVRNPLLDSAAKMKAQDMAENEYFAHYSPSGVSPWHWFTEASYNFANAGENLAIHFSDSDDVVDAWMKSPTHRANIMNGSYTEIGVGTAEGMYKGTRTVFVVQLFGTPAEPRKIEKISQSVENNPVVAELASTASTSVLSKSISIEAEEENPVPPQPETTPETNIPVIDTSEDGYPLYSDFISTTTDAVVAKIEPTNNVETRTTSSFFGLFTQPHKVLQTLYVLIGVFVLIALLLSIFIEIRRQKPIQVAYGVGLLVLMFGLFYLHNAVSTGVLII